MGEKDANGGVPPPQIFRRTHSGSLDRPQEQNDRQQRVSWAAGGQRGGLASNNPFREGSAAPQDQRPSSSKTPNAQEYQPPSGPPPTHCNVDIKMEDDDYDPPSGSPPSYMGTNTRETSKAPSSREDTEPPPYDPWVGPDDSLRPPPSFAAAHPLNQKSPAANADYDDAARAHAWCRETSLWRPTDHDDYLLERLQAGDLRLTVPPNTTDVTQYQPALGRSYIRTSIVGDTILLSDIPIYAANRESPLMTGHPHALYYEVHVMGLGDRYNPSNTVESGIGVGFVAPPYPAWRLPGWHRASLGVHSDDGRRYIDNSYGGQEFTTPIKKGEVIGIGMTFQPPVHGDRVSMRCQVFFTRNGKRDGWWDLHEEKDSDADEGDITGLEGEHDLLAAVGVFGSVELECVFRREEWLFKP